MINQEDNCTIRNVHLVLFCHICNAFAASEIAYFVNNWFPGQMVHTRAFSFLLILKQTSDWTNQVNWVGQSISDLVNSTLYKIQMRPRLSSSYICWGFSQPSAYSKNLASEGHLHLKKTWQGRGRVNKSRRTFSLPFPSHLKFKWSLLQLNSNLCEKIQDCDIISKICVHSRVVEAGGIDMDGSVPMSYQKEKWIYRHPPPPPSL